MTIEPETGEALIADKDAEIARLRKALLPFAQRALTRLGQSDARDEEIISVPIGWCRAAQRAMGAD